jgi:hypothetical protein
MGLLKPDKTLAEIEEDTIREDAMVEYRRKQLIRKQIEERLGNGGMKLFKAKGDNEQNIISKAANWLKTH